MKTKPTVTTLLLLGGLLLAPAGHGGMYKWVDDEGGVHYTQTPPRDREVTKIKAPSAHDATSAGEALQERQDSFQERRTAREEQKEKEQEEQVQQDRENSNCEAARRNLARAGIGRARYRDKDGDLKAYSDAEMQARSEKASAQVEKYCAGN